mmetsp:Transcript_92927/g.277323  ORF Transcript_92927/g.277323 Transcript_92927/m.277323 type:complete len:256 (+) Transcript_92927:1304-2071(+)
MDGIVEVLPEGHHLAVQHRVELLQVPGTEVSPGQRVSLSIGLQELVAVPVADLREALLRRGGHRAVAPTPGQRGGRSCGGKRLLLLRQERAEWHHAGLQFHAPCGAATGAVSSECHELVAHPASARIGVEDGEDQSNEKAVHALVLELRPEVHVAWQTRDVRVGVVPANDARVEAHLLRNPLGHFCSLYQLLWRDLHAVRALVAPLKSQGGPYADVRTNSIAEQEPHHLLVLCHQRMSEADLVDLVGDLHLAHTL